MLSKFTSLSGASPSGSAAKNTVRRVVFCLLASLLISVAFIAPEPGYGTIFPDNLRSYYPNQDFNLRTARISGDVRLLERHYSAQKTLDGQAALAEVYRRACMTNELRNAAVEYRALLKKQPASAWKEVKLWLALARSHEDCGEWNEALQNYRRSLEYSPSVSAWGRIMEVELIRKQASAAEAACREWLKLRSAGETLRRRELARLYERLGAKNVAAETYARACERLPLDSASLIGYLRVESSSGRRVDFTARTLARDGHNLNTIHSAVEVLISQGRAQEARRVLDRLQAFFTPKKSSFYALLLARTARAAEEWDRAASWYKQARLWRENAPPEEKAYSILNEAESRAYLKKSGDVEALLAEIKSPVWDEGVFFVRLRLMAVSKASAEAMGSLIQSFVSPSGQENKNLNTNFMNKLSDFSGIPALVPLVEDLWLRTLQKNNGDAIAEYEAGRFFLRTGKTEKAYELFVSARKKMRAFGDILPYLAVAAEKTGRADEAKEYRIQACYLLGGERFAGMCAEILDGK